MAEGYRIEVLGAGPTTVYVMLKAIPEHGPDGVLQSFNPELSIAAASTTPGPLAVLTVQDPVAATPLMQIEVRVGLVMRVPRAALVGLRNAGSAAT